MHIFKHIPLETALGGMHYYLPCLFEDNNETQERKTLVKSTKVVGSTSGTFGSHCGLCSKSKAFQSQNTNRVCVSLG